MCGATESGLFYRGYLDLTNPDWVKTLPMDGPLCLGVKHEKFICLRWNFRT